MVSSAVRKRWPDRLPESSGRTEACARRIARSQWQIASTQRARVRAADTVNVQAGSFRLGGYGARPVHATFATFSWLPLPGGGRRRHPVRAQLSPNATDDDYGPVHGGPVHGR